MNIINNIIIISLIGITIFISGCSSSTSSLQNYIQTHSNDIFFSDLAPQTVKKVVFVVDDITYQALKTEIDRFADDIASDLNAEVKIISNKFKDAWEVKDTLSQERQNGDFDGVIFIGDVPPQVIQLKSEDRALATSISDFWYLDFENTGYIERQISQQCNGFGSCFDRYLELSSNYRMKPVKIWSSRIYPPFSNEKGIELLRVYFNRNHDFRQGKTNYRGMLLYLPDETLDRCITNGDCIQKGADFANQYDFAKENELKIIKPENNNRNTKDRYLIEQENLYKFQFIHAHGQPTTFSPEGITYSDLVSHKPGAMFTEFASCDVGNYLVGGNSPALAYLYEGSGLAVRASSVALITSSYLDGGVDSQAFHILGRGGRIFEAFESSNFYYIFGDPTLRVNTPVQSGCRLAINQTRIDMRNVRINENGIIDNNEATAYIKITNLGTEDCIISKIDTTYHDDLSANLFVIDKITLGQILEEPVGFNPSIEESKNSEKIIDKTSAIRIISNDPQYIKEIPVSVRFVKS